MYKNITLNEFIGELKKLAVKYGNEEISSVGSSSGKIAGMSSPFCFNFKGRDATEFVPAYQHDINPVVKDVAGEEQSVGLRRVWMRVGMSLDITKEEEQLIFDGDFQEGAKAILNIMDEGRAVIDGDTYIPEDCIEDYDEKYGTNYRSGTEERSWCIDGSRLNVGKVVPSLGEGIKDIISLNVSDDAKKELLVGAFKAGQEYFEKDVKRYFRLTHTNPEYIWCFDVFDANKEPLYSTSCLAVRLAMDILSGYIVPASMSQEKSVDGLIAEAVGKSEEKNKDCVSKADMNFEK